MEKIDRFLKKLDKKMALKVKQALLDIMHLDLKGYTMKKMRGYDDLYRLRVGKIRIVFRKLEGRGEPIDIGYRGGVYKKW
jgi:mRNA interferase RelE/StbE